MRIGQSKSSEYVYQLDCNQFTRSEAENDIGVIIDSNLTFDKHISAKISKANSIIGLMNRSFEYKDK